LVGLKGVPSIVTSDGRTIRYPDPLIKINDTVRINIATGKIEDFVKFDSGKFALRHCYVSMLID
jgi:small subunit ribosomal protein S4e